MYVYTVNFQWECIAKMFSINDNYCKRLVNHDVLTVRVYLIRSDEYIKITCSWNSLLVIFFISIWQEHVISLHLLEIFISILFFIFLPLECHQFVRIAFFYFLFEEVRSWLNWGKIAYLGVILELNQK